MSERYLTLDISQEWLQTRSGDQWFPRDPDPGLIKPKDLATSLSRIPRFSGHTREFYSVAQHSIFVANLLAKHPIEIRLAGMLHDAEEAYTGFGDLQAPIRALAGQYRNVKERVDRAVEARFSLPAMILEHRAIREADLVALATEKRDLLEAEPAAWKPLPDPAPQVLQPWSMQQAAKSFEAMLYNLTRRWERELDRREADDAERVV